MRLGDTRSKFCEDCEHVTLQRLEKLLESGSGEPVGQMWRCLDGDHIYGERPPRVELPLAEPDDEELGPLETPEAADAALRLIAARRGEEAYRDELHRVSADIYSRVGEDASEEAVAWEYLRLVHALARAASTAVRRVAMQSGGLYDEMDVLRFIEAALKDHDEPDADD